MMGRSFWGRIIGSVKGLFSKAAPHISNLVTQAQPNGEKLAGRALESVINNGVTNISENLVQKGGRKKTTRKRLSSSKLKTGTYIK